MNTIIPGMLTRDGEAVMPFGVMGGHYQAFGHAYFLTNLFEYGMDLQQAMDLPRLFPAVSGPVEVESGMPEDVVKTLESYGHETQVHKHHDRHKSQGKQKQLGEKEEPFFLGLPRGIRQVRGGIRDLGPGC